MWYKNDFRKLFDVNLDRIAFPMIRLIIVDDHKLVREAWKLLLSRDERIEVIAVCESGEQAIEAAKNQKPDVMLMDITMEPMNGVEATAAIRAFNTTIKIIGVSVHSDLAHVNAIIGAGANGYITKNSSGEEMVHGIFEIMSGKTYVCKEVHGYNH